PGLLAQAVHLLIEVDLGQQVPYRLGPDAGPEGATEPLLEVAVLRIREDLLDVKRLHVLAQGVQLLLPHVELVVQSVALLGSRLRDRLLQLGLALRQSRPSRLLARTDVGLHPLDLLLPLVQGARTPFPPVPLPLTAP